MRPTTDPEPPGPERHVLMLLSNEYTFDGRVRREAATLIGAGHRVTVIAWDRAGGAALDEELDGVRVVRVRTQGAMKALPFDVLRLPLWWRRAAGTGLRLYKTLPFDLIHAHDYDTLPAAVRLKRATGAALVYDAHEVWEFMVARDLPAPLARAMGRHETRLLRHADQIITVSDPCADHLRARTDRPVSIVMNAKPRVTGVHRPNPQPRFRALYIGTLNATRLVVETITAARNVPGIEFVIAGTGKPGYVAAVEAAARDSDNVRYLGRVPEHQVLPMTLGADLVVCLFAPTDALTRIGMPNKVFEAIATGRPVLATQGTYLGDFVTQHRIGLAVAPDADGITDGLRALSGDRPRSEEMGRRALLLSGRGFDWSAQERTLLAAHEAALRPAASAPPVK